MRMFKIGLGSQVITNILIGIFCLQTSLLGLHLFNLVVQITPSYAATSTTRSSLKTTTPSSSNAELASNEILIKLQHPLANSLRKTGTAPLARTQEPSLDQIGKQLGVTKIEPVIKLTNDKSDTSQPIFDWYKVTLPGKAQEISQSSSEYGSVQRAIALYSANPNIVKAEPDFYAKTIEVPNDPYYSSSGSMGQSYQDMWGMHRINMEGAWDQSTGSGNIIVADIDTGVDYNHPDLSANILRDNTGSVVGWNFVNNSPDPMDDNGHGTHTAGTIGAAGNNGQGVVGVNWKVSIMPVKFLDNTGTGGLDAAAEALVWAADKGAKVSSNSWGAPGSSTMVADAIRYEYSKGMVVVAAAGNSDANALAFSPANLDQVITVSATGHLDQRSCFSNFGEKIDVSAPGGDASFCGGSDDYILSTRSSEDTICAADGIVAGTNYCGLRGTSMAAPHVAGLAALLLSKNPNLTNEQVRQILREGSDNIGSQYDFGFGRIDGAKTLALANTTPLTPIITSPASYQSFILNTNESPILTINGGIAGPNFASYSVEMGLMGNFSSPSNTINWKTVANSTTQVSNGVLASIDLSGFSSGIYDIRLTTTDQKGNKYTTEVNQESITIIHPLVGRSTLALTNDSSTHENPAIDGNNIVWDDNSSGTYQVYLYNISSGTKKQITAASSDQKYPQVSGNYLVWVGGSSQAPYPSPSPLTSPSPFPSNPPGQTNNVYLYDIASQTTHQLTTSDGLRSEPHVYGNHVVWIEENSSTDQYPEVYLCSYDSATGSCPAQLITNDNDAYGGVFYITSLDISSNFVFMSSVDNSATPNPYTPSSLFGYELYDLSRGQLLDGNLPYVYDTSIDHVAIDSSNLVWQDIRTDYSSQPAIWMCPFYYSVNVYNECVEGDLSLPLTAPNINPAISGNRVIWQENTDQGPEIIIYDLASLKFYRLQSNLTNTAITHYSNPVIDHDNIVVNAPDGNLELIKLAGDQISLLNSPTRIIDTRSGSGYLGAGQSLQGYSTPTYFNLSGISSLPSNATAIVANVAVANPTVSGYLSIWPKYLSDFWLNYPEQVSASSINFTQGQTAISNSIVARIGADRGINIAGPAGANVVVDLVGYLTPDSASSTGSLGQTVQFLNNPTRIIDTRIGSGYLGAGQSLQGYNTPSTYTIAGKFGLPTNAVGILSNTAAIPPSSAGYLTDWPAGLPWPGTSSLNYNSNQTTANQTTVKLGTGGAVNVSGGSGTNLVVDLTGYIASSGTTHQGDVYLLPQPQRFYDTRPNSGYQGAGQPLLGYTTPTEVGITGNVGVPVDAEGIIMNIAAASPTSYGNISVWPAGNPIPGTSNINYYPASAVSNLVVSALDSHGAVSISGGAGTNIVIDILGYIR